MKEMKDIKILAVDDENGVLRTLQSIFSDSYTITTESDPRLAADLIRKERFDLFLIDYQMPVMNGIRLLERIKQEYKNRNYIAILCTAAGTTYLFKEEFTQNLFSYYAEKPFDVNHLKRVVTKAITELHLEKQQLDFNNVEERSKKGKTNEMLKEAYLLYS